MKKGILLGVIALAVMMFGMSNVSAEAYSLSDLSEGTISAFCSDENVSCGTGVYTLTLEQGDTLYVIDQDFVGDNENYFLIMSDGAEIKITLDVTKGVTNGVINVEIVKGTVTATTPSGANYEVFYTRKFINGGTDANIEDDDVHYPMNFIVDEDATLIFDCDVLVTATTGSGETLDNDDPATITNNGTVYYTGNVTVENGATLNGNGANYVSGTITFKEGAEENLGESTVLTLTATGSVVVDDGSNSDIFVHLTSTTGDLDYDEDTGTYSVVTTIIVDEDDTVLGDTTDTTTDVETEEEVENPQTFDAVSLYVTTAVVSVGALVGAVIYLKRKNA